MDLKNAKVILKPLLFILLIFLVFRYLLFPVLNTPQFKEFVEELGILGYLVIILYLLISQIFAPISATPGLLLGIAIYGVPVGVFLLFISSLISAVINFWISRKYGRKRAEKFIGKEFMEDVDTLMQVEGTKMLILIRIFGISIFDVVSYAMGLTHVSFKSYFIVTAVVSFITNLIFIFTFNYFDIHTGPGYLVWVLSLSLITGIFGYYLKKYMKNKKSKLPASTAATAETASGKPATPTSEAGRKSP